MTKSTTTTKPVNKANKRASKLAVQAGTCLDMSVFLPNIPVAKQPDCAGGVCTTDWKPVKPEAKKAAPKAKKAEPLDPDCAKVTAHVGAVIRQGWDDKAIAVLNAVEITFKTTGNKGYCFAFQKMKYKGDSYTFSGAIAADLGGIDMATPNQEDEDGLIFEIVVDKRKVNSFGLFPERMKSGKEGLVAYVFAEEYGQRICGRTQIDGVNYIAMDKSRHKLCAVKNSK